MRQIDTPGSTDLPSTQGLTTFAIVARHHSFSSAAEELEVGQSAVSHAIRQLERWFGCALFDRDHRGIRLTEEGRILADGRKRQILTPEQLSACYGVEVRVSWKDGFCAVRPA